MIAIGVPDRRRRQEAGYAGVVEQVEIRSRSARSSSCAFAAGSVALTGKAIRRCVSLQAAGGRNAATTLAAMAPSYLFIGITFLAVNFGSPPGAPREEDGDQPGRPPGLRRGSLRSTCSSRSRR
jgi:hypothetical protein